MVSWGEVVICGSHEKVIDRHEGGQEWDGHCEKTTPSPSCVPDLLVLLMVQNSGGKNELRLVVFSHYLRRVLYIPPK